MNQPAAHHFHLAHLVAPALDGVLRAIAARDGLTAAQRLAKSDDAETLIMSFQPRDAIELMLAGQIMIFHEMLADGARVVLHGVCGATKQRGQSTLVALGRLTQGHIDRLEKRGLQPHRTEVAAPHAEPRQAARVPIAELADPPAAVEAEAAPPPVAAPPAVPPHPTAAAPTAKAAPSPVAASAAPPHPEAAAPTAARTHPAAAAPADSAVPRPAAAPAAVPPHPAAAAPTDVPPPATGRPPLMAPPTPPSAELDQRPTAEPESSWLDAPHPEWLVETPTDIAHRTTGPAANQQPPLPPDRAGATIPARIAGSPEPMLPHLPAGYPPTRTLVDAAAD